MAVTNGGLLLQQSFGNTNQVTSTELQLSERCGKFTLFVAPTGVNVTVAVQVPDPAGAWHTIQSNTTNDGNCDALDFDFNPGSVRALVTPSAGAGSVTLWAKAV